jgi:DNA-binding NarL/FixJ family response regulator
MINIIIIDDHKVLLEGIEHLINRSGIARVENVGTSATECRTLLECKLPDVLILDVNLPDGDGCDLCAELVQKYPSLKIMMLTTHAEIAVIARALDSGALGYVLKSSSFDEIFEGIYAVSRGNRFLCEEVEVLLKLPSEKRITLTGRERNVLKLICDGKTYIEIADELRISNQTAKDHRSNLLLKLDARNTAELVKIALDLRLV